MEKPGIDPGTSRMLSERSTIWANSPYYICHGKVGSAVAVNHSFKEAQCSVQVDNTHLKVHGNFKLVKAGDRLCS